MVSTLTRAELFAGRQVRIASGAVADVLWIEADRMPVTFIGGVMVAEGDGRPFEIHARWGIGSVTFESVWQSLEGAGLLAIVPACDALFISARGLFVGPPMQLRAAISRDVRLFPGAALPFDPTSLVCVGSDEDSPPTDEGGVTLTFAPVSGGDEVDPPEDAGIVAAMIAGGEHESTPYDAGSTEELVP